MSSPVSLCWFPDFDVIWWQKEDTFNYESKRYK